MLRSRHMFTARTHIEFFRTNGQSLCAHCARRALM